MFALSYIVVSGDESEPTYSANGIKCGDMNCCHVWFLLGFEIFVLKNLINWCDVDNATNRITAYI